MWRKSHDKDNGEPNGKPPFLSSWKQVYGFVLGVLALLIFLFHLFTENYK